MRINIFRNGDLNRQKGKVVVLSSTATFSEFLQLAAKKFEVEKFTRAFTQQGGEISEIEELYNDDIVFLSQGEDFNSTVEKRNLQETQNEEQNPNKKQKIETYPLILVIRVVEQFGVNVDANAQSIEIPLKHRYGTVLALKKKISFKFDGLHPADQTLIYQAKQLEDEKRIHEYFGYGKPESDQSKWEKIVIFLMIKPLEIYIKSINGSITPIVGMKHSHLVQELKTKYKNKTALDKYGTVEFIYEGKFMQDGKKLSDFGIRSGCIIFAQPKPNM